MMELGYAAAWAVRRLLGALRGRSETHWRREFPQACMNKSSYAIGSVRPFRDRIKPLGEG